MVSLFGSKPRNDDPEATNGTQSAQDEQYEEATERTRLLPQQQNGAFLTPDDPAVTPMNLWSVRILHFFTIFFLVVTFIWWILLLVSMFVTPPGMTTPGSGFFDFSFTTLTAAGLLIITLFFATPSKATQAAFSTLAFILFIDMILIVAVTRTRHEEGWVGITSVVWALLMSIWAVSTDRVVAWGKAEEEERLTGRPETRRTLSEWLSVLSSSVFGIVFIVVAVLLSCVLCIRARDASLAPPGKMYAVDGNKYLVHLHCVGSNNATERKPPPTILVEAGEDPSEQSLIPFMTELNKFDVIPRFCYWDRPGFAWSDNGPSPMSGGSVAQALAQALAAAGEDQNDLILVSAGVGSIYSRIFSSRRGNSVKGLLMIDPTHEAYLTEQIGTAKRGFFLWLYGIISPLGFDRIPGTIFRGRNRADRVYGRSAYQGGKQIKAKLQEALVAGSLTTSDIVAARAIQMKTVPLAIISSSRGQHKKDTKWADRQRDLTKITDKLALWSVVDAPHEVWTVPEGRKAISKAFKALFK